MYRFRVFFFFKKKKKKLQFENVEETAFLNHGWGCVFLNALIKS
jgi:hypothetical protein